VSYYCVRYCAVTLAFSSAVVQPAAIPFNQIPQFDIESPWRVIRDLRWLGAGEGNALDRPGRDALSFRSGTKP
jgi:hypothetical protein